MHRSTCSSTSSLVFMVLSLRAITPAVLGCGGLEGTGSSVGTAEGSAGARCSSSSSSSSSFLTSSSSLSSSDDQLSYLPHPSADGQSDPTSVSSLSSSN
ncbi:hypothetical protein Tco_0926323 [Tanacetum coccineum]|uniref:Secreted protein n=1 Tax=Tanacetum coccineum TaxID=301880 RepID=A0ABQ5DGH9_9ASTR